MKAIDIMTVSVVTATRQTSVQSIVRTMLEHRISAVPIVDDEQRVVGIVSEGDLMNRPEAGTHRRRSWWLSMFGDPKRHEAEFEKAYGNTAADVMTRKVVTVHENDSVASVAETLERLHIKRVPVVRDGKLVGIISRANLLQCVGQLYKGGVPEGDSVAQRKAIFDRLDEAGLRSYAINVIILKDAVELWGIVDSAEQRKLVRLAVASVLGDRKIDDHLGVMDALPLAGHGAI
jgi:CBS domain-containing protein